MSIVFDNPEYPDAPAPLPTDTLVDSVVILLALTVVQRLVGFMRAVLFCRWLDAEQLGQWDMAFSFLLLASPLSVLALPGAFGRYLDYFRLRGRLRALLGQTAAVCGGLALPAVTVILFERNRFSALVFGDADHADMFFMIAVCLMAVIAYNYLSELFTALRRIRLVSVMQLLNSVAFAVLGVALLLTWQCSARSVVAAYGGASLLAASWAVTRLPRVLRDAPRPDQVEHRAPIWAKIAPCALWTLTANVLMGLFEVVDRYMIVHFSRMPAEEALAAVGNYHSSRLVPMLLVSVATLLSVMMTPHLSHDWETGRRRRVRLRLRLFVKLFGLAIYAVAAAVLLAAPLLFSVAFRGKFPFGEAVLPWTLMYCAWFGLQMIVQNYLLCAERTWLSSAALLGGLALSIPLNLVLLPRLGLQGAVLATTAAHALSLGLVCLFNRRLGFRLDLGAALVLLAPLTLCLGVVPTLVVLGALLLDMVWGHRLLTAEERKLLAERAAANVERFGLERFLPESIRRRLPL